MAPRHDFYSVGLFALYKQSDFLQFLLLQAWISKEHLTIYIYYIR